MAQKIIPGQALAFAWEKTKTNLVLLIGMALVLMIFTSIPSWLFARLAPGGSSLVSWILGSLVAIGAIKIVLKVAAGTKTTLSEFFNLTLNQFLDYIVVSLIYFVIVAAGLLLLVVPGIIWMLKYQFAVYLVVDKKMQPLAAIKRSAEITAGHKGSLFILWLLSLVIVVIGALLFGVGLLLAAPLVMLAQAYAYRRLTA